MADKRKKYDFPEIKRLDGGFATKQVIELDNNRYRHLPTEMDLDTSTKNQRFRKMTQVSR